MGRRRVEEGEGWRREEKKVKKRREGREGGGQERGRRERGWRPGEREEGEKRKGVYLNHTCNSVHAFQLQAYTNVRRAAPYVFHVDGASPC